MNLPEGANDEPYTAEEQLALSDEEDSLPWLEDDGDYEDEGGFDARLIWFTIVGLLVLGAILVGAWWLLRDRPNSELVADGTVLEAPDGPYKERPENPGGRQVEGTGDTAYQVAEGEAQRGRLADAEPDAARPSIDVAQGEDDEAEKEAAPPAGSVFVQIGAYTSRADASQAWVEARSRYSAVSGLNHRIVEAEVNGAKVYRLQVIAANRAAGDATCRAIRNAGGDCYIR
ncbi:SPOR domain-containing protein [Aurantiacibacter rhizosphaerae]|uniref:SPOR domain-containing protein n=1 Tax=Aurantiacibacter rhizosphaerae TaxID=2691582 RepID=A0A844XCW1_9SPHN|nr:SPOR domain-containing protein [Aurantiacibacter rhizosphaerae]MWV27345.1 SPOR domain-containing protein [Aurantiacibacter rhizosphaerae]